MTHVDYHPIEVTLADGRPVTIYWRGFTYSVLEINEPWRLTDRWWEPADAPGAGTGRSDRTYYRQRCASARSSIAQPLVCIVSCS